MQVKVVTLSLRNAEETMNATTHKISVDEK